MGTAEVNKVISIINTENIIDKDTLMRAAAKKLLKETIMKKKNYWKEENTAKRGKTDQPVKGEWTEKSIFKRKVRDLLLLPYKQERNRYYARKGESKFDCCWCKVVEIW